MKIKIMGKNMKNIDRVKNICEAIYDPARNVESVIRNKMLAARRNSISSLEKNYEK